MVAGRGVTHSERTSVETRRGPHSLFGVQTWVALPETQEDAAPSFEHHAKDALPTLEADGARLRLILGAAYGQRAPASVFSETFYVDAALDAGARLPLPNDHEDRGLYIVEGAITVAGQTFEAGRMLVFRPGDPITIGAGEAGARLLLLGGATLGGPRYIWWNFVASSRERIEAAKEQWRKAEWGNGLFDLPPDDRSEFIPAPFADRAAGQLRRSRRVARDDDGRFGRMERASRRPRGRSRDIGPQRRPADAAYLAAVGNAFEDVDRREIGAETRRRAGAARRRRYRASRAVSPIRACPAPPTSTR